MGEKMRTTLDVKRAVEAVRSDFLQHRSRRGDSGASSATGAAAGGWIEARQGHVGGDSPAARALTNRLEAAAVAMAGSTASVRRGSQAGSPRASGSTVTRASCSSQQDAWGLVPGSGPSAQTPPPSHVSSVSRSSIKRTSVDLTQLDDRQLAAAAVPASVPDQYLDTFATPLMPQHVHPPLQASVQGSRHFHHPSDASVGSLMEWSRPPPFAEGAGWPNSVGCISADSAKLGMLRRATPSAPYPGGSGGIRRASAAASVARSSLPSSIKRASGSGVRSALGPVSFGPPDTSASALFNGPAPPQLPLPGGQNPFETRGRFSVARRSYQRPVRSEAVANLLSDGPVRSAPMREVLLATEAEGSVGLVPPVAARRPYRSVRAASEGVRRGPVARESFLANAARLSARVARPGEDAGGALGSPFIALTAPEPSEGSLTSMCACPVTSASDV